MNGNDNSTSVEKRLVAERKQFF